MISTTDDNVIAQIVTTIRERMNPLIVDMISMAKALDVPSSYLRLDLDIAPASDPDLAHPSATIQDLLLLLFDGAESASNFSTAGGREFFDLKKLDNSLRGEALPYSLLRPEEL